MGQVVTVRGVLLFHSHEQSVLPRVWGCASAVITGEPDNLHAGNESASDSGASDTCPTVSI